MVAAVSCAAISTHYLLSLCFGQDFAELKRNRLLAWLSQETLCPEKRWPISIIFLSLAPFVNGALLLLQDTNISMFYGREPGENLAVNNNLAGLFVIMLTFVGAAYNKRSIFF